ncbi:MAG: MarR family winged helix-turn-helix transcriptional regulator [Phreatobacter sp.]|uniref:MarR family winged helix-turn-helix transcriptional regulator n=1 Tax=Phreatobacter sp. TaxID=1966341 RepID=UPI0027366056|nr:MarR family winged helix-turn-helix transcriptional regulator [Phreatobacter sp.]MDP2801606.1 MarR family winged helix-turn-helix transcriptional regulator [Phreatobacter sp.]
MTTVTSQIHPPIPSATPVIAGVPDEATVTRIARSCICYQTRMTAHAVTRAYNRVLAPLGLEVTQFNILAALAVAKTNSVTALSEALALDRTTMTRNLKRLGLAGLVSVSTGQGRAVRPALTQEGAALLSAAIPLWEAEHVKMEEAVGADVWGRTRDGLRAIRRSVKDGRCGA